VSVEKIKSKWFLLGGIKFQKGRVPRGGKKDTLTKRRKPATYYGRKSPGTCSLWMVRKRVEKKQKQLNIEPTERPNEKISPGEAGERGYKKTFHKDYRRLKITWERDLKDLVGGR